MIEPAFLALLVTTSGRAQTAASSFGAATWRAIPISSVASIANEEDLVAAADDAAKNVHVPNDGTEENLDGIPRP